MKAKPKAHKFLTIQKREQENEIQTDSNIFQNKNPNSNYHNPNSYQEIDINYTLHILEIKLIRTKKQQPIIAIQKKRTIPLLSKSPKKKLFIHQILKLFFD